ncbi:MAG: hypothetical protein EOP84_21320 [Verrucomicrobiaceae bacterium]|nr:MAG: hypothetical protein EOP84_21320 [Verrucomicrobiaceae bacterium]
MLLGSFSGTRAAVTAPVTVEKHPLTEGANWNGLLSPGPGDLGWSEMDQPLVWQQAKPLVLLRTGNGARHLHINFDFEHSNAERLPAMVLLLSRFIEETQDRKIAPFAENFETYQVLPVPSSGTFELMLPTQKSPVSGAASGASLRAPLQPGFFSVRSGTEELLRGAARFGDPRETDFQGAVSTASKLDKNRLVRRENLSGDRFAGTWLALVAVALVGSWFVQTRMARA